MIYIRYIHILHTNTKPSRAGNDIFRNHINIYIINRINKKSNLYLKLYKYKIYEYELSKYNLYNNESYRNYICV